MNIAFGQAIERLWIKAFWVKGLRIGPLLQGVNLIKYREPGSIWLIAIGKIGIAHKVGGQFR